MEEVEIYEQNLYNTDENGKQTMVGKVAVLRGGIGSQNPKAVMDQAVNDYVGYTQYNQFLEIHLDNPWVRVVIKGINELDYQPFIGQRL